MGYIEEIMAIFDELTEEQQEAFLDWLRSLNSEKARM